MAGSVPEAIANDRGARHWRDPRSWFSDVCDQLRFSGKQSPQQIPALAALPGTRLHTLKVLYKALQGVAVLSFFPALSSAILSTVRAQHEFA